VSDEETRDKLAAEQEAVVAALMGEGPVPSGFDPEAVAMAGRSLANKRRRDAEKREAIRPPSRRKEAPTGLKRWLGRIRRRK